MTVRESDFSDAHRHFSVACFNGVWDLIEKPNRSPDEAQLMVSMAHASLYHWQHRQDCQPRNLSVGYWQLSRVYSLVGEADHACKYGQLCLTYSQDESPFLLGYAYEAIARAEQLSGNHAAAQRYLDAARERSAQIENDGERKLLEADLATIVSPQN